MKIAQVTPLYESVPPRYYGGAVRVGSVPEVMEQGHTGFIVEGLDDVSGAVRGVSKLSRKRCRAVFEHRFTASRMARDCMQVFERLIATNQEEVSEAA